MKRLVVDANVLQSAGHSDAKSSINCRQALEVVRRHNHRVVINRSIEEEWDRHQSIFSRRWRATMESLRNIHPVSDEPLQDLRDRICAGLPLPENREQALKDVHLLEAALRTDKDILSCEHRARNLYHLVPGHPPILEGIAWVDPVEHGEETRLWLENGADPLQWPH